MSPGLNTGLDQWLIHISLLFPIAANQTLLRNPQAGFEDEQSSPAAAFPATEIQKHTTAEPGCHD